MEDKQFLDQKVVRSGMVAVAVSPGFGAGWYSWNTNHKWLLFHPLIIEKIENGKQGDLDEGWIKDNFGIEYIYTGGASGLKIEWVAEGSAFSIDEYDGSETLVTIDSLTIVA